jgi:hypothetical protein
MGDNMGSNGIKRIAIRNERFSLAFDRFVYIEDKHILGNGILINKNGNVIWDNPWKHSHTQEFYVKKHNLLITNRISRVRALGIGAGLVCMSLDTGRYLWANCYSRAMDEKYAIEKELVDINLEKSIEFIDAAEEYLYTRNFKVNILSGNYEFRVRTNNKEEIMISNSNKYLKEIHQYKFYTRRPLIKFSVETVKIDDTVVKKRGYSFNKSNEVINNESNLYFFATPEEDNPKGIVLFTYSKKEKKVVKEIELPFRGEILGVYDFFDNGILIHEEIKEKSMDKNLYGLWFIPQAVIDRID